MRRSRWVLVLLLLVPSLAVTKAAPREAAPREAAPREPAQLVPAEMSLVIAGDAGLLRSAGPPQAVQQLLAAFRAPAARIGADPSKLGAFAAGVLLLPDAAAGKEENRQAPTVLVADLPVDPAKLAATLEPKMAKRTLRGTPSFVGRRSAFALLPNDRVLVVNGAQLEPLLAQRPGRSLLEQKAGPLLEKLGTPGGHGAAIWGYLLTPKGQKDAPTALEAIEELGFALVPKDGGGDFTALGHCKSAEAAQKAAGALKDQVAQAASSIQVMLLGLQPVLRALQIEAGGNDLKVSLHLTPASWGDLMGRAAGLAQTLAAPKPDRSPSLPDGNDGARGAKPKKPSAK